MKKNKLNKIKFEECRCVCHVDEKVRKNLDFCWGELKCKHCDSNHKGEAI